MTRHSRRPQPRGTWCLTAHPRQAAASSSRQPHARPTQRERARSQPLHGSRWCVARVAPFLLLRICVFRTEGMAKTVPLFTSYAACVMQSSPCLNINTHRRRQPTCRARPSGCAALPSRQVGQQRSGPGRRAAWRCRADRAGWQRDRHCHRAARQRRGGRAGLRRSGSCCHAARGCRAGRAGALGGRLHQPAQGPGRGTRVRLALT